MIRLLSLVLMSLAITPSLMALPIDINGSFYADTTYISNFRGTEQNLGTAGAASQEVPFVERNSALFQNYLFRLDPTIIVNDSVTIKGEITNGFLRGGFLGDNTQSSNRGLQNLYFNTPAGNSELTLNKAYAEIYSETALFRIGRFDKHWGMGLIQNAGRDFDDRFFTVMDGIEATFKLKKFEITPYWARIADGGRQTSADDVRELGVSAKFVDKDQDFEAGILVSQRATDVSSTFFNNTKVNFDLIDLHVKKTWGHFDLELEVPIIQGEAAGQDVNATAGILNGKLALTNNWSVSSTIGHISGQDEGSDFTASNLNPNFQVAHLLFRYNYFGVEDNTQSIFDAGITNAVFAKVAGHYKTGNWNIDLAFLFATANESAQRGQRAFNHSTGQSFNAVADQDDNLGFEADLTVQYQWYPNVTVEAKVGYLALGDHFAFTNTATELELEDPWLASIGIGVDF